jgi:NADH dehydrogenase (ubiquinone) 1 alpha/beta subcomplex 1
MGFWRRSALVDATRTGVAARRDRARRRRRRPLRAASRASPELPDAPPSLRARNPDRAPRSRSSLTDPIPLFRPPPSPPSQLAAPALAIPAGWRLYGAGYLDKAEVTDRVVSVVKNFNKVDPAKVSPTSSFGADLGLDSLDTVEVVMAVEEEFAVEIPDAEADKITSVGEAVEYLVTNPNAR